VNYQELSKIEANRYEFKILLKILRRRYLRKKKKIRTREVVKSDYNDKAWSEILASRYWENAKDLKHFTMMKLPYSNLHDDEKVICLIGGKLVRTTLPQILGYCHYNFCKILKQHITKYDKIVELGCGFGLAVFSYRARGLDNPIEGYDVSENAIKAAKMINNRFNCEIEFGIIDLSKPFDASFLNEKTVFTSHSLEQLRYYTDVAIKSILSGRPKQVIHFEPVPELLGWKLHDIVSKQHNEFADYQNNLLSTLKKFESRGLLKILNIKKIDVAANPFNETTFIRWQPV